MGNDRISTHQPPSLTETEVVPPALCNNADIERDAGTSDSATAIEPPYSIFSPTAKAFIVCAVSISALISPFGATTFYPALNVVADALHVSASSINISLTTYMIAQAIAPAIIAGMSDQSGRRLSFIVCFTIYILANIGLALQTDYAALLVLRMVQAAGCSASIALSMAVVADIATSDERGKYVGFATAGILFGPAFGPTIGGLLAQYLGWRSIFWFLAVFTGCLLFIFTFFFPETCRNVVGNGSIPATGINRSIIGQIQRRKHSKEVGTAHMDPNSVPARKSGFSFPNPLRTLKLLQEKESCIILLYNGLFFTGMMMVTASLPTLFQDAYALNELQLGLCYIAMGAGSLAATLTTGHVVDWNFRRHARKVGLELVRGKQQDLSNFPIEQARFEVVAPGHWIGTAAYVAYGWTVKCKTHIAGPEVALFFIGFGVSIAFNITNTLLMDLHRGKPATATAAVNFVRCLMSAGGAAAIVPMIQAINPGWAFTFIALVYVVLYSAVVLLMKKGMKWRCEQARNENGKRRNTNAPTKAKPQSSFTGKEKGTEPK